MKLYSTAVMYKTVWNQLKNLSVIGLPKFTSVNMAGKYHEHASFGTENLFFAEYCFGSLIPDGFLA